jgi:hypothetical protein
VTLSRTATKLQLSETVETAQGKSPKATSILGLQVPQCRRLLGNNLPTQSSILAAEAQT